MLCISDDSHHWRHPLSTRPLTPSPLTTIPMDKPTNPKRVKSDSKSGQRSSSPALTTGSNAMTNKTTPKDVLIVTQILKDMGITEYEPRIVHQMIEFTYRYVSNVLEDAHLYSSYAKKKTIDSEDVNLAIQLQVDKSFTGPPPRDLLMEIARNKNNQTLPAIKSHNGPRLPPDRYSLISCNYKQKSNKPKPQSTQNTFRSTISSNSNANTSSSILKPLSATVRTDSQTFKRKLDES